MREGALRRTAGQAAFTLGAALVFHAAAGADATPAAAGFLVQQRAGELQRCLERGLSPLQIESSVSRDGRLHDTVRVTLSGSGTQCQAGGTRTPDSCGADGAVRPVVGLSLAVGNVNAAWSANDRARLEEALLDTLSNLGTRAHVTDPRRPATGVAERVVGANLLRVSVEYGGSLLSQRDLEDWLRLPQSAEITIELVDTAGEGRVVAARKISARTQPGLRGRLSGGTTPQWRARAMQAVARSARDMLAPLACSDPMLAVNARGGKLWLDSAGFTGLAAGRALLLVPVAEVTVTGAWPIALVKTANGGHLAELEVQHGSAEACMAGCRAIPL